MHLPLTISEWPWVSSQQSHCPEPEGGAASNLASTSGFLSPGRFYKPPSRLGVIKSSDVRRCPQQGKPSPGRPSEQLGPFQPADPAWAPCGWVGEVETGPGPSPQALLPSQVGGGPPWGSCDFSMAAAVGSRWPSWEVTQSLPCAGDTDEGGRAPALCLGGTALSAGHRVKRASLKGEAAGLVRKWICREPCSVQASRRPCSGQRSCDTARGGWILGKKMRRGWQGNAGKVQGRNWGPA